jgi:uncharacterized protein (TIGR01777 family)
MAAWDGMTLGPWADVIDGADVVINLAGRSVNCRYNESNRRNIKETRTVTTRLVGSAIGAARKKPRIWLNASTATIYRHALDRPMDELTGELGGHEPGVPDTWNFSIDVARSWEEAFFSNEVGTVRKVALRMAIVMNPDPGGTFELLSGLVRKGLGGTNGSGNQFVSWLHDTDLANAVDFLIARDDLDGPVNLSAPNPVPNRDFMRAFREAWGMKFGLPAPAWMLEVGAFLMRSETELVLKSRRVVPTRLLEAVFVFAVAVCSQAASDLVRCARGVDQEVSAPSS